MQGWRAFLLAVVVIELAMLALVCFRFAPAFVAMIVDVQSTTTLPRLFRVVTAREYPYAAGVGLAVITLAADRIARDDKQRVVALAMAAVGGAGLLAVTLYGLYQPIFAIAGKIK
jgi:hypothetical protein